MYIDTAGDIVVYGPPDSSAAAVKAALSTFAPTLHIRKDRRMQLAAGTNVRIIPSQFPFSHLVVWQEALSSRVKPGDNITSIDADEQLNRLTVGVSDAHTASQVLSLAANVGVPTNAVSVRVEPITVPTTTLQGAFTPRVGGIQILNTTSNACTLGFDVTTSTGITGFVTASHCAPGAIGAGTTGTTIYQNNTSFPVGTINVDHAFNIVNTSCGAYSGTACTWADVMLVKYNTGIANQKWIMQTTSVGTSNAVGSITTSGTWQVNATDFYPSVGESVDKMGRTTGWTRGHIGATCLNHVTVDGTYSYMVICTDRVDSAAIGQGDSGAPVFYQDQFGLTWAVGTQYSADNLLARMPTGEYYCNARCSYYFNPFQNMQNMIGTTPIAY